MTLWDLLRTQSRRRSSMPLTPVRLRCERARSSKKTRRAKVPVLQAVGDTVRKVDGCQCAAPDAARLIMHPTGISNRERARSPLRHGFEEYGEMVLGINDEKPEDIKGRYEFPCGDFKKAHRCGVITAESRAGQYKHFDIENSAAHLHGMIDARAGKLTAGTITCLS